MAPPKFDDLVKATADLLKDDFVYGERKVTVKTKTSGVALKAEAVNQIGKDSMAGVLEAKFTPSCGVATKLKYKSANSMTTEFSVANQFVKGSSASVEFTANAKSLFTAIKAKAAYSTDSVTADLVATTKGATVGTLFAYKNFFAGASASVNADSSLGPIKLGAGYREDKVSVDAVFTKGKDATQVDGYAMHSVGSQGEAGVHFSWASNGNTKFALGGKYVVDKTTTVKAKISEDLNLSLAATLQLNKNLSVTTSALANVGQKSDNMMGFSLNFA